MYIQELYIHKLYILPLCWMVWKALIGIRTISAMWTGMEWTRRRSRKQSSGPHAIIPAKDVGGEKRWKLFGTSAAGRYLVVVFTNPDDRMRPITAHTMNQRERRIYAPEIGQTS